MQHFCTVMTIKKHNVRWRMVMRHWQDLSSMEKVFALTILAHANREGWATLSPIEIKLTSGGMDNRTQEKVVASLESQGYLQTADSDNKRKRLYRLRNPKQGQ